MKGYQAIPNNTKQYQRSNFQGKSAEQLVLQISWKEIPLICCCTIWRSEISKFSQLSEECTMAYNNGCPLLICQSYVPIQMRNQMFLSSYHSSSHKHEYTLMLTSLFIYQTTCACTHTYMYIYYIDIRATPGFCPGVVAYIYFFNKNKMLQNTVIPMGKITKVMETIKQTMSKHPKFLWEK